MSVFGDVNLEQTLATLLLLSSVVLAYKPIIKLIQKKTGLQFNPLSLRVDAIDKTQLYNQLLDIYRTPLTGQTVDEQIIQMEEQKYVEYSRLGGNGFVDKARGRWQEHVVDILLDGQTEEDKFIEKTRQNKSKIPKPTATNI